ncbi:lipoprotein [Luteimicrobium album]|uniref:Lipoprotein n=1 Tax=Luteimicrobium album TaxID=1054550 RepID=A0ABQ6HWS2_9MICO|nr:iron uptake system protein EfeO [Luteimicrobium album]GMA22471.1 lipoprotein [Luteimicrobium album]
MQSTLSLRTRPVRVVAGLAGVLGVVALVAAGCSSDDDTGKPGDTPSSNGVSKVDITLTAAGGTDECQLSTDSVPAGPVTFTVTNKDSAAINEVELQLNNRIVGEKENLAPGLSPVSFTSTLDGGAYEIYCPGAEKDTVAFTVTGEAAATPTGSTQALLAEGVDEYSKFVTSQVDAMVVGVDNLKKAVDSGNLEEAQKAYATARPFYEKIESDVDGFVLPGFKATDNKGNLDYLIDMRASSLDPAVGWHGFHAVERDLFEKKKIDDGTKKYAAELATNVGKLQELSKTLEFKPEDLANGAAGLLEEVQANKITGEEEKYSHLDLSTFAGNVEGAEQAFADLQPGLDKIDPDLAAQVTAQFDAVKATLKTYQDTSVLGGYELWTPELRKTDATKLSQAIQALQQPLSKVAEKVATAQ